LKAFTERAVAELNTDLAGSGGAGSTLNGLVTGWSNEYVAHGWNATNREPADYQAVTIGQLKYIASLYYGQLAAAGYAAATPAWVYPDPGADAQVATVGQLKTVFDFDVNATLAAPTSVIVTAMSDGSFDVSWQDASPNVTGYTVQYYNGTTWVNLGTTTPDITDFTVAAGAGPTGTSSFRVTANNSANSTSASSSGVTPPSSSAAPAAPSGLTVSSSDSLTFHLAWQDNSGGTASFVIKGNKSGGASGGWTQLGTVAAGTTSFTVTPDPNYLWLFQVFAQSGGGSDIVSGDGADTDLAAHYALIDTGEQGSGMFINNSGQMVYTDTNGTPYFWSGGTSTPIIFPSPPTNSIPSAGSATLVGLNNNGQVAASCPNYFDVLQDGVGPGLVGNSVNQGTALWTAGGGFQMKSPVSSLLSTSLTTTDGTFPVGTPTSRWNAPVALNDSGDTVGSASEHSWGPFWLATEGILDSSPVGEKVVATVNAGGSNASCTYAGRMAVLTGINNSGTIIGYTQDYALGPASGLSVWIGEDYPTNNPGLSQGFYGSGMSALNDVPTGINDNGDIVGDGAIWLHSTSKKFFNSPYAPSYVNNHMQAVDGWQDYRVHNLNNMLTTTNWSVAWNYPNPPYSIASGIAISPELLMNIPLPCSPVSINA
ncbi:fibronectin type III domain-containing protein, partial [Methylacidiphilales bacterium]|nr:fibronectin type III domain-containing protein [Candidatus Methylacidiphilales bacterium]